jgi:ribonuclease T2
MRQMNSKTIIRIVLSIVVAALGAWQLQSSNQNSTESTAPHGPRPIQGQKKNDAALGKQASQNRSNEVGDFDYYVVSFSWSPSYCVANPNDKRQCGGKGFGFVLHGLWPQKQAGGYPADCATDSRPSAATVQKTLAFMPSEKLIQHEWAKHGSCSGLTADEYFRLSDRAFASLIVPKGFDAPSVSRNLSPEQITEEFLTSNPGLTKENITVNCKGNELQEVRLCVDKQLKPMSCGKGVRTQCGRDMVQVRSVR